MDKKEFEELKATTLNYFSGYSVEDRIVAVPDGETFKPEVQKYVILQYKKPTSNKQDAKARAAEISKKVKKDIFDIRLKLKVGYHPAKWTWDSETRSKTYTQYAFFGVKYFEGAEKLFDLIFSKPAVAVVKESNPYEKFAKELL